MTRKLAFVLIFSLGFILLINKISSAEVVQSNTPPNFAVEISDYILVSSSQQGNVITKTFRVKLQNIGAEAIGSVVLTLIHGAGNVVVEDKEVVVGDMSQGEIITSSDTFSYSVDEDQLPEGDIEMTWQVEYVVGEEKVIDEVLVSK